MRTKLTSNIVKHNRFTRTRLAMYHHGFYGEIKEKKGLPFTPRLKKKK